MKVLSTSLNQADNGALFQFTQGIDVDRELYREEISVQKAWANVLVKANLLTKEESQRLHKALSEAQELMAKGQFEWKVEDEDIHMNLERFLVERTGELGKKIHWGRSRNDLIATTLRLFVKDRAQTVSRELGRMIDVLLDLAQDSLEILIPGRTHLQHGQPVRMAQLWSAYAWAAYRERKKYQYAMKEAMISMPLGSGAFAGTTLDLDLQQLARELGFSSPPQNGYDAVGDRDFMLELLGAFSLSAVHLGRMCEDLLYYSSTPIALLQLPQAWTTGSSMMPNKRNPDICELIRAKSSRIVGLAHEGASIVKSTPTSYGSDLHELKRPVLLGYHELSSSLGVLIPFLSELKVRPEAALRLLSQGHILATELADYLTELSLPFRDSYQKVAKLIAISDQRGCQVHELPLSVIQKEVPEIKQWPADFMQKFSFSGAVEKRKNSGGTSLAKVKEGMGELKRLNGAI